MEVESKMSDIMEEVYPVAYNHCRSNYNGSDRIYGEGFEDIFQSAVFEVYRSLRKQIEDRPELAEDRLNPAYFHASIINNFDQQVSKCCRRRRVRQSPDNLSHIKKQMYNETEGNSDFEEIEVSNFLGQLSGRTKAFVKLSMSGAGVREIQKKLGLGTSMRKFYKVRSRIENLVEANGYESE